MSHTRHALPDHTQRGLPPRGALTYFLLKAGTQHDQYPLRDLAEIRRRRKQLLRMQWWARLGIRLLEERTRAQAHALMATMMRYREATILALLVPAEVPS